MVEVVWDDAAGFRDGWKDKTDPIEPQLALSVGFMLIDTSDHIILASDTDERGAHNGRTQIPRGMVKNIKIFKYLKILKSKLGLLVSFGRNSLNSLWWKSSAVIGATAISDFVWARYIASISLGGPMVAGLWAAATIVLGAYIVVSYVGDRRLILPAGIGAFIGTYLAV
jgi:hypothetical protein